MTHFILTQSQYWRILALSSTQNSNTENAMKIELVKHNKNRFTFKICSGYRTGSLLESNDSGYVESFASEESARMWASVIGYEVIN